MKVAHATDHITHAVIGGKQATNFGISDDPAFFQILSSALYKDPMLAMVRETICNAWDSHIESGLTDTAIKITLGDDYLIIQDFGGGIPDSLIGPIYGIYGASTKKNDGRQTGGFGLGCKSPFAYTDHFEVTSCHAGIKTIYNMSKSSAELNGRPSITPIASFPTTDTGITVKIPLNQGKQNFRLTELVRQVVFNGDIKAKLNELDLPILGLDIAEHGLILMPDGTEGHLDQSRIYLRYGNVIYPVESAPEYKTLYAKVSGLLSGHYGCRVVLLAPPDSISITPSRESLTLSDITNKTVNHLLGKFLAVFIKNQQLLFRHKEIVHEYIDAAAEQEGSLIEKLPTSEWQIPGVPHDNEGRYLSTTEQFAKLEVILRYSGRTGKKLKGKKWLKYIQRYLYKINENKLFDQGLMQSWVRTFQRGLDFITSPQKYSYNHYNTSSQETALATKWWQKRILLPLVERCTTAFPSFDMKSFSFMSDNILSIYYERTKLPVSVSRVKVISHTRNALHLMKPTVFLTHNAHLVPKRLAAAGTTWVLDSDPQGTFRDGAYFIYEVSRRREELETIKDQFKQIEGIEFFDITERLPHEEAAYQERREVILQERADHAAGRVPKTRLAKKVRPGMVRLDVLIDKDRERIDTWKFTKELDPARIVDPKLVLHISTGKEHRHETSSLDKDTFYKAALLYGSQVGVSNKSNFVDKQIEEKEAVEFTNYLYDKIIEDMDTIPSLQEYFASDRQKILDYIQEKTDRRNHEACKVVELLIDYPELSNLSTELVTLSNDDRMRYEIWCNLRHAYFDVDRRKRYNVVQEKIAAVPLKPEIIKFLDQLLANPFLVLINTESATRVLRQSKNEPVLHAKLIELIKQTLT